MRRIIFCLMFVPCVVWADGVKLASTQYVQNATQDKVDTSAAANQTMAGSYTVSGTLVVPTPALPTAE